MLDFPCKNCGKHRGVTTYQYGNITTDNLVVVMLLILSMLLGLAIQLALAARASLLLLFDLIASLLEGGIMVLVLSVGVLRTLGVGGGFGRLVDLADKAEVICELGCIGRVVGMIALVDVLLEAEVVDALDVVLVSALVLFESSAEDVAGWLALMTALGLRHLEAVVHHGGDTVGESIGGNLARGNIDVLVSDVALVEAIANGDFAKG